MSGDGFTEDEIREQNERIKRATEEFDLTSQLIAARRPRPEADTEGNVVWRHPHEVCQHHRFRFVAEPDSPSVLGSRSATTAAPLVT